jgi:hypothetical protein
VDFIKQARASVNSAGADFSQNWRVQQEQTRHPYLPGLASKTAARRKQQEHGGLGQWKSISF